MPRPSGLKRRSALHDSLQNYASPNTYAAFKRIETGCHAPVKSRLPAGPPIPMPRPSGLKLHHWHIIRLPICIPPIPMPRPSGLKPVIVPDYPWIYSITPNTYAAFKRIETKLRGFFSRSRLNPQYLCRVEAD